MTKRKPPEAKKDELSEKQEAFCQRYIEKAGNASEAYRLSYNADNMKAKTVWEEASRLLADPKVSARVAELQQMHVERHCVTVTSITKELEEARSIALADRQASAAVSASLGKAKIHGLLIEKQEHTGKNGGPIETKSTVTLTPEEAYRKLLNGDA